MKINTFLILLTLAGCFFSGCSSRPSYVLSEKQMEDVLYDLYLAEVEMDENRSVFGSDSTAKQNLLNSVFKKHKIKEQTFDTSLVWYNANLDKYLKINGKIGERFDSLASGLKREQDRLWAETQKREWKNLFPDTAFFFFLQSPGLFQNRYVFKTDSVQLHAIKSFDLSFDVLGIRDSIFPVLSFSLQTGDTVFVNRDTISSNGAYFNTFSVPNNKTVKEIYGYFIVPDKEKTLILVKNIVLCKQEGKREEATMPQINRSPGRRPDIFTGKQ